MRVWIHFQLIFQRSVYLQYTQVFAENKNLYSLFYQAKVEEIKYSLSTQLGTVQLII